MEAIDLHRTEQRLALIADVVAPFIKRFFDALLESGMDEKHAIYFACQEMEHVTTYYLSKKS